MMPMLFVLLLVLAGYSLVAGASRPALDFLFQFNYHQVTAQVIVLAIGQAFLSVGVCSGMMVIYGAYVPDEVSIPATSLVIVGSVIGVSILSGLVIFPLVFAYGLQPDQGAGLIFETLPVAFGRMPFGHAFGAAFFLLLLFASATSSVALLEQVTAWLERRFVLGRWTASIAAGAAAWCVGVGSVLSFNVLKDVRPLRFIPAFANDGIFEIMDFVTTTLMLLAGGVALAVFAGWRIGSATAREELRFARAWQHTLWRFLLRYVVLIALVLVLLFRAAG
jgi:NSS family neurotransmitter:Na+ symporter